MSYNETVSCPDCGDLMTEFAWQSHACKKSKSINDRFPDGSTDWHNWMKYTAGIDPNDEEKIRLVWKVLGRCFEDCEAAFLKLRKQEEILQGAKNTEQANQPDSGEQPSQVISTFGGRSAVYPQADTPTTRQVFGTDYREEQND